MDIYNSNGIKLEYSEVLANLPITESCEHVEELMKADHIVLSWRDSEKYTLPVGAYITYKGVNYALLEPYEPEQKSGDEFEYTPNFQHPKMYLGKVPFRFPTTDTEGNSITLLEWPYSGDIDTLLTFFCRTMESELGLAANTFNYSILGEIDMVVSTTFNAVDILSALSNVANQLKCEWHIDWDYKILYFGHIELSRDEVDETVLEVGVNVGTPSVRSSKEGFYNTYEPQGSTRNISKRAASGEYVQGDVRLALNVEDYPDKVIYTNESGTVIASLPQGVKKYVKPLIFDNIYPKLDLYVYDVRCRERYLLDDNGEKIIDHYDGSTPVYKRYAVWYMRLAYPTKVNGHVTAWTDYTINPETDIISGKNLGGAFQPNNYNGAESFPLAGRGQADDGGYGFELIYHSTGETIPASGDDTGVVIKAGDYEIVFQQQNDYILPTTATQGIIPKGVKVGGQEVTDLNSLTNLDDGQKGNIVDLYNIVIDNRYNESAQNDLAQETLKYIANQFKDNNSYTLKSDVVAFKKRIDQDELLHTDSSLYIGEKVIYKNGDYELETRVMKLVTKLDYAFVQEITVGNEVLKGSTTTLKEQVQTILSGGGGNGSGGVDSGAVRKIVQAYTNPRFLSKIEDDTAQGFITMLKGLQIGANFEAGILGEGGVLRMNNDGKVELVVDTIYARMRAYFDSVVVREYKHESGNRIVSPAQGFNASRVEYIKVVNNEETIVENASDADYFRCYWRVDDGEKKSENQFVIGDLAFCEHSDIINGSLVTKRYWRVVRGRNAGNITTEDGEAWIDLSNAHDANGAPVMTTISWVGQGGVQQSLSVKSFESSTNGIPEAHDDICMLGCVVDTTRQGAIIEYVSGTNAPAYQIYQGIGSDATNPYVLTNKNQITLGYNSQTGKAEMKVYGDAYIGARDRSTYIEYKQDDGTQQHNPSLDIKAKIQTLPNSTYEGKTASQFVQDNQIKYGTEILALQLKTQDLQNQIDGAIESYFMTGVPSLTTPPVMNSGGSTYAEPWLTGSETQEERIAILNKHIGDLYYDKATGHGYRFLYDDDTSTYMWTILTDEDVTEALRMAAEAQETADGKSTTFLNNTSDSDASKRYPKNYKKGDTWILQVDATIGSTAYKAGDILTASVDSETYNASHWSKQVRYTDDTAFNGYIDAFLNGSSQSGDSFTAAAIQKAITSALGSALGSATLIDGGLMLTSLIGMRQLNDEGDPSDINDYTTWAGISGQYVARDSEDPQDPTVPWAKGHGIAAWYGGDMVDKEMLTQAQIDAGWGTGVGQYRWAKSVDRFDGSGYRANGNITWNANGELAISDITSIQPSGSNTNVLNDMIQFSNAFHFNTVQGGSTILNIVPQYPFYSLYLYDTSQPNNRSHVASQKWVDDHYVTKTFFRQLFRAFKPNATAGQADVEVEPNTIDATISNIKAMVGFWTEQYVSALGQGSDGGGGGGASVLYKLNDVSPNATGDGVLGAADGYVLTYNGSTNHWYAAPTAETYVLPTATANALGGIKIGYATSGKNYAVQLVNGQAFVNVPWENTTYTLAGLMGSSAIGGATQPIYWNGSAFENTTYTLAKSVPADAKFTDTTYSFSNADATLAWSTRTKIATTGGTDIYVTLPANPDTWRNIFLDGTEKLTTSINTKGLNFVGDEKTTISFLAAGTGSGQSGNANYATLKISSTWRGIQDNLTSTSTTDSLSANQGKLLNEKFADYLPLTGGTLTGNLTINTSSGDKFLQIGDIRLVYDSTNVALKVVKSDGTTAANFYATGAISALGQGVDGGGGGQGDVTWALLADGTDTRQVALSHLTDALSGYSTTSHTHTTTIATDSGTSQLTLAYGTKYKITAGGTSFVFTMPSADDTNTWRNIYVAGTQQITTAVTSKALNFAAGSNVSLSFAAAGTGSGQSGNANYGTLTISATDTTYSNATQSADGLMSAADKKKLDGIAANANNYSLPTASSSALGGVKIGYTTDAANRNYAVQLSSEKMYVNVPWTDTTYSVFVGSGSTAAAGLVPKPSTTAGTTKFLREDATWVEPAYPTNYYASDTTRTKNTVLAAPNGSNGVATFRALVAADIPNLGAGKITSGTFDAARIPDLSSTYAAVGRVDDLESYFTNGVANKAEELNTSRSLWGQSFNGTADVSGNMSSVGDISFSASGKKIGNFLYFDTTNTRLGVNTSSPSYRLHVDGTFYASGNSSIGGTFGVTGATTLTGLLTANGGIAIASSKTLKIGDIYLAYDSTNNAIEVYKLDGTNHVAANLYARGGIAALGETSDGGGGGQGDVTWALLASDSDTRQIALSHLTTALSGYSTTSHTHTTTIAAGASGDTSHLTLAHGTKYKLTAGGTSYIFTMPSDNNSWRNVYVAGTEKLTTATNTKAINFVAGNNVSISFAAAGTGSGQSGNANYGTLTISATDTTYTLAGLMGSTAIGGTDQPIYWNGSAFANTSYTVKKSVPADAVFTDHYAWSDITSKPLTLTKNTTGFSISGGTTSKTLTVSENYTLGAACAKGVTDNSSSTAVTSTDTNLITGRTLYYAGYVKSSGVTSVATGTGLTGGTITGTGTISISSTYQTYISHGESAYNSLSNYLPITGGTITQMLTISSGADSKLILDNTDTDTYWSLISFKQNGIEYGYLGTRGDTNLSWNGNTILHTGNVKTINGQSINGSGDIGSFLLLSGGDMTGTVTMKGSDIILATSSSSSNDSGDLIWKYGNGNEKMRIWADETYSSSTGPNFRIYNNSGSSLYSGRIAIVSEIPTNNNQLTNGAGYITSNGSCAYATNAGTVGGYGQSDFLHIDGGTMTGVLKTPSGFMVQRTSGNNNEYFSIAVNDIEVKFNGYDSDGWVNYYFNTNNVTRMFINGNNGYIGINTVGASYRLHVAGDIYATGGVTSLSDIRKKDVVSYNLPLNVEQIANAPTIKFLWKDKREEGEQVGTIAQYWQKVLPWVVKDKSNELSMQYGVAALVAAITTARKVVDHEKRITELEKENKELREEISRLKIA